MPDLSTTYMGIRLKNPLIIGACNLMKKIDRIKEMQESGAGAVVYRSLFQEQIELEELQMKEESEQYDNRHPMMIDIFPNMVHAGPREHLLRLEKIRKEIDIPLIGSLNCMNREVWVDYAARMEQTGIDGLELNLYSIPSDPDKDAAAIEKDHLEILSAVKQAVSIPVSAKLSFFYTNPLNAVKKMDRSGIDAFVLFNRLFQPDIDIKKKEHIQVFNLSRPGDHRLPLRYSGLLFQDIQADICASSGIFTGKDMVRLILAGADAVQCVSTLYRNKIGYIETMLRDLKDWMEHSGYEKISDFKGELSNRNIKNPFIYDRSQYIDILMNKNPVIKDPFPI